MNILFITHRIPYPPDKGDKIRCYHILKYLAERHRVSLAGLVDDPNDLTSTTNLRRHLANLIYVQIQPWHQRLRMARALLNNTPLTVSYFWSSALKKEIDLLVEKISFDVLFVFSSTMAEYCWNLKIPIKIIDFCDLDSAKFLQYGKMQKTPFSCLYHIEGKRLAEYEKKVAAHFDHIIFINDKEKKLFIHHDFDDKITTIGNGVDFDYYENFLLQNHSFNPVASPYLVFTGSMNYLPNIDAVNWFCQDIYPLLKQSFPDLQLFIIGRNPTRKVKKWHTVDRSIRVTGYVANLGPYLKNARVFIAPMRIARGMQTKILEAMACGIPVVTTSLAANGIGATPDKELLVADTTQEFMQQVAKLLMNATLRNSLTSRALDFLRKYFNWDKNLKKMDNFLPNNKIENSRCVD